MENLSPYFNVIKESTLNSINELIELNKMKKYSEKGFEDISLTSHPLTAYFPRNHETCGIFRGQAKDWPLIPASYRNEDVKVETPINYILPYRYGRCNNEMITFCKLAALQNHNFPSNPIDQISIAQHYGLKTPLLDWTTNIFVAAFFALDLRNNKDEAEFSEPYIYHLEDERLLQTGIENEKNIIQVNYSALVKPAMYDRRIERQFSVFSFHPHPLQKPEIIPVTKYKISGELFMELWKIMSGLGYSASHFFPDYAGIAEIVKSDYMI